MHTIEIGDPSTLNPTNGSTTRLEPMLVRLPPALATELRDLARRTRVRQSDYLREAVADLLAKYAQSATGSDGEGSAM
ncbi:MAG TPA: ribbon-helix-helix domain-containing protein [Anaeromyxobacter sp.]|nr:ribbon-helix-helix domain-containing protein [Anaeromyxobacter sp.]